MNEYQVANSAIIEAPPAQVYAVIADYHAGHPAILPSRYFNGMQVVQGGQGAGTEITVDMEVFGVKVRYRMQVMEPEPGRVLVEQDEAAGVTTTFTVDPVDDGCQSRVTISTRARTSRGIKGMLEKWMNPWVTRRIYREELDQLAQVVQDLASTC